MNIVRDRRFMRRVTILLIAAQVLLSAPVASAYAAISSGADAAHCAEMMSTAGAPISSNPCPCCPEAEMGVAACLSACAASVGVFVTFTYRFEHSRPESVAPARRIAFADQADPPIKPPPIV